MHRQIYIDEDEVIEDDKEMDQEINRADNDVKRLTKPKAFNDQNSDPNVFVSSNQFKFQEPTQ